MRTYKVLNTEWETIVVDRIDPTIHKHRSGREFTEDDKCVINIPESPYANISMEEVCKTTWIDFEVEYTREQAIDAYKEKFGRKPSSRMKIENIIDKL